MDAIELSDDESVAIFTDRSLSAIRDLDRTDKEQVLKRLIAMLESPAPSRFIEKRFAGCEELEQLRAGDYLRVYCRLVRNAPGYNILFVFGITAHKYRNLARYDEQAQRRIREVTRQTSDEDVNTYVEENDALAAADLRGILDTL